jgi:hypothetical protein
MDSRYHRSDDGLGRPCLENYYTIKVVAQMIIPGVWLLCRANFEP